MVGFVLILEHRHFTLTLLKKGESKIKKCAGLNCSILPIRTIKLIMSISRVNFNTNDRPEFFSEVREQVNQHFKDKNISKHGNTKMNLKVLFMLVIYFGPLATILSGQVTSLLLMYILWMVMGFGMAGIGLTIMHDANHGSFSKHKGVNRFFGFISNFIGAYHVNWKIQHNVLHHSFTNIDGHDEDIAKKGIMRFSPNQKEHWIYRFQIVYAPILYGLLSFYWLIGKDFDQVFRYDKMNLLKNQGLTLRKAMGHVIFHKSWYLTLTLLVPIYLMDFAWWQVFLGFFLMHYICGMILALIFQPAHVVEETSFYVPDKNSSVENNWAIHQMHTTTNFANNSRIFSWLIGGLNFQIEHHLFPNICHVHYKEISSIVKKTAKKFDVPYYQHRTYLNALRSHFLFLIKLGKMTPKVA